jgi:predicted amidohydrolase
MMKSTVAALQTSPQATMSAALDETLALAEEAVAAGATFLGTPEYCGGLLSDGPALIPPHAHEEAHDYLNGIKQFASANNVWFLVGSIAITGPEKRIYNRGFLVDNTGQVRSRYTKIHMFDVQLANDKIYRESVYIEPGEEAVLMDTPVGSMGHTICYDLRFPTLYRELAQAGAQILAIPAAFTRRTGEKHWHVLNRARAIENGAFVFAPCSVGSVPGGGAAYGHSLIIDPWGEVLADGGEPTGVVMAEVDLAEVERARSRIPSLNTCRTYTVHRGEPEAVA